MDGITLIPNYGRVRFGFGAIATLGEELAELGIRRPLIATEKRLGEIGILAKALAALRPDQKAAVHDTMPAQPTVTAAEAVASLYKAERCDGIVAIGGGVVIDACTAGAILTGNPSPLQQYSGHPEKITGPVAPIVAIPTTAGTGSEVTRGAGIHPAPGEREFSSGGPKVLPKTAICDPELTLSLPARITAGTGMDALGHCVEGFLSPAINPVADAIALDGIRRVVTYIERAVRNGGDREARWHLMLAATQGGKAIAKGLGAAHALSMTFSDSPLHHGALVTISLPAVLRFAAPAVPEKMPRLAEALGARSAADVPDAVARLNEKVGLPASVRELGYKSNDYDALAAFAAANFFNRGSPRAPDRAQYRGIIQELLQ
jgi:alcohol dehydrogenase class IV